MQYLKLALLARVVSSVCGECSKGLSLRRLGVRSDITGARAGGTGAVPGPAKHGCFRACPLAGPQRPGRTDNAGPDAGAIAPPSDSGGPPTRSAVFTFIRTESLNSPYSGDNGSNTSLYFSMTKRR